MSFIPIRFLFFLFGFFLSLALVSTESGAQNLPSSDSTLSPINFFESVAKNHPLVRQAGLFLTAADRELLMARGQFDPKLLAHLNRKSFDGKEYYNLFNPEIKAGLWPGIDVKAGFERNTGIYVNEEDNTPLSGLQYLGVSVPLGQGLITDARRVAVKQARLGMQMADAERQKQVNKVLFSAAKSYWEWFFKYQQLRNAELAFSLASERYNAVRVRILVGDLASIDSVEALIFRQDRELFLNQARIEEQNARLDLSSFFWSEDEKPLDLLLGTRPVLPAAYLALWSDSTVAEAQRQAITNHPEIQKIAIKTRSLELDRSLGREMLKPLVQVNYSWLSRTDQSVWATQTLDRNYKFGFDFALPLFLRKERGKLGLVKTKLLQNNLDFQQAQRDLNISIQMSANEMRNLNQQIEMQNAMVENYQKLRNAEIRKFENGESSLFLINSREAKLIESIIKQASLVSKFQKERAALLYAAGRNALLPF